jgi:hypothetical protein
MELFHGCESANLFTGNHVIGIKGLPGRMGIGIGHRQSFKGQDDPDGLKLREWIGDDAGIYLHPVDVRVIEPDHSFKLPKRFNDLIQAHSGKRIAVLGGAPSLQYDLEKIDADIWISANEHGVKIRPCDYIVTVDEIHGRADRDSFEYLRQFSGAPIVSPCYGANYLISWWPGAPRRMLSGLMAAWCGWQMGGHPVILAGFDSFNGDEGAREKAALFKEQIKGHVRQCSGMDEFWPRYDPGEDFTEYVPVVIDRDIIKIRVRKPVTIRGMEWPKDAQLEVERDEVKRFLRHRMVVECL